MDVQRFSEGKTQQPFDTAAVNLAKQQLPPFHLATTAMNSFDDEDPTYIMNLAAIKQNSNLQTHKLAASSSDFLIKLYDYNSTSGTISFTNTFKGHTNAIQDIQFSDGHPDIIASGSEDKTAVCWDMRSGEAAKVFRAEEGILSVSLSNTTLAAATETEVLLWDIRNGMPIKKISEFHTSEITRVRFKPSDHTRLFTGSDDGTVCQFDLTIADLDEALLTVMNTDQPVQKMGFFGPADEYLYAISTVETLSLWNCAKGNRVAAFPEIRLQLSQAANAQVDYLVNCHYNPLSQRLFLSAGTFGGGLLMCHVNATSVQPFCMLNPRDGHKGVIRDCLCFDETLVSGGQDSKLCVWKSGAAPEPTASSSGPDLNHAPRPAPGGGPAPASRKFKPY